MDIKPYHACDAFDIESVKRPNGYNMKHLHYHNSYELYFLEMGEHSYLIKDKFLQITTQDVVLLKPNVLHKSHDTHSYNRTCIYFTEEFLHEYFTDKALNNLLQCFEKDVISLDNETYHRLQKKLSKIKKEYAADDYSRIFIHLGDVLTILNAHMNDPRREPSLHSREKITPILTYISDRYREIKHLDEIAEHFFISTPHLCRIFKKHTGMTLSNYINHVKIQHACELLAGTGKSVNDIALECGFNSSMYFCKTFKSQIGCTPSEFRAATL